MQPLLLSSEGSTLLMRRERLANLVYDSLYPLLPRVENAGFLERFRYALVSSPLLDKQLLGYTNKLATSKDMELPRSSCKCELAQSVKKYWAHGGCVIVIITIISYAVKEQKYGLLPGTQLRTVALVVISFGLTLFLFSHSRKKLLRNLRTRVLANTKYLIDSSQRFDLAITKSLSTVRETELMARGYRPDLVDADLEGLGLKLETPIARIELSRDSVVMGKHLRSTMSAGLYLCTSTCLTAVQEIIPFCNERDLEKYLEIYEIDLREIDDFGWESIDAPQDETFHNLVTRTLNVPREEFYGASGANASLQKIKLDLSKLHFLRRLFICCLLSMQTSGRCEPVELEAWDLVDLHLENLFNLNLQLSKTIIPNRIMSAIGMPGSSAGSNVAASDKRTASNRDWQKQVRSLNNISSTLQHIEARMEVLRDTSISLIEKSTTNDSNPASADDGTAPNVVGESGELEVAENEFEYNFNMIGADLKALLGLWEEGKQDVKAAIAARRLATSTTTSATPTTTTTTTTTSVATDSTLASTHETLLASPATPTAAALTGKNLFQGHHRRQSSEFTSLSGATVLEGMSDVGHRHKGLASSPGGVVPSRADRIKQMHAERAREAVRRQERMARASLVEELGSVLDHRGRGSEHGSQAR